MADLISSLGLRLAASAVSAFVSPLIAQFRRQARINQALSGDPVSIRDGIVQKAHSEITRVIGSYRGELTVDLASFLEELQRSGLSTAIVSAALTGGDDKNVRRRFHALYEEFGLDSTKKDSFYDNLKSAFKVAILDQIKDKPLLTVIETVAREIENQVQRIAEFPKDLLMEAGRVDPRSQEYKTAVETLANSLHRHFREVTVQTVQGVRRVPIEAIYVEQSIRFRRAEHLMAASDLALNPTSNIRLTTSATIDYLTDTSRKTLILGDPGGGKSTLLQYLCYRTAGTLTESLKESSDASLPSIERRPIRIPVRIVLRDFESVRNKRPEIDLIEYATIVLANISQLPKETLHFIIRRMLEFGQLLVAFDGLDEILQISQRKDYAQLVSDFCSAFPLCRYLVSSRIVGYKDAPLAEDFDTGFLHDFTDEQVASYVRSFMRVVADLDSDTADQESERFLSVTMQHGRELRSNPLMLQLMCSLYQVLQGDIPENRPEIYRQCAILMFQRWDRVRGINAQLPSDFDLLELLTYLASQIYGHADLETGVSTDWLMTEMRSFFEILYEQKPRAFQAASEVREFVTGRAWVMTDVGVDRYKFTHKTFLEYFYARHLANREDTIRQFFNSTQGNILSRQHVEPMHLAVQVKAFDNRRRAETIEELLSMIERCESGSLNKANLLQFSMEVLHYLPASEPDVRRLVKQICAGTIAFSAATNNLTVLGNLDAAEMISRERRRTGWDAIWEAVREAAEKADRYALAIFDRLVWPFSIPYGRGYGYWGEPPEYMIFLRERLRKSLGNELTQAISADPRVFAFRWRWMDVSEDEILRHLKSDGILAFSAISIVDKKARLPGIGILENIGSLFSIRLAPHLVQWQTPEKTIATLHALERHFRESSSIPVSAKLPVGEYLPLSHQNALSMQKAIQDDTRAFNGLYAAALVLRKVVDQRIARDVPGKMQKEFWLRASNFESSKFRRYALARSPELLEFEAKVVGE